MKKTAKKITSKKVSKNPDAEKIVIPPDLLKGKISNETVEQSNENVGSDQKEMRPEEAIEQKEELQEPEKEESADSPELESATHKEPSFFEKVTGEKPPIDPASDTSKYFASESEISDTSPQIERLNRKLFFLGGFVFLLTVVIATIVGVIIINTANSSKDANIAEEEVVEQIATPTPQELDRSEYSFEVLNGSGEAGKAKKTADAIEALGYVIEGTGNAEGKDYSGVTVLFVSDIDAFAKEEIIKDLKREFLTVTESDSLDEETAADILVIVGK